MVRTQISLSEHERELLEKAAQRTGKSMSALIREAVDLTYGEQPGAREDFREKLEQSFGAWKDRDFDGAAYVDRLRSGRRLQEAYRR
jgi:hypothetical protein